jgi:hypothetical protein
VRDRETALEVCQAVGTATALLTLAWAAIELAIGVDLLGIVVFAVLASIAIAAVLMIVAIQNRAKPSDDGLASKDDKPN